MRRSSVSVPTWHVLPWLVASSLIALVDVYAAIESGRDLAGPVGVATSILIVLAALGLARPSAVDGSPPTSPISLSSSRRDSSSTLVDDASAESVDKVATETVCLGQHDSIVGRMFGLAINPLFKRHRDHDIDAATLPELPAAIKPASVLLRWRETPPPRWLGRSLPIRLAWFFRRELARQQVFAWIRALSQAIPPLTLKLLLDW